MGGQRLDHNAIKAAIVANPSMSDREIASLTGASVASVYNIRRWQEQAKRAAEQVPTAVSQPVQPAVKPDLPSGDTDTASQLVALFARLASVDPEKVRQMATDAAIEAVAALDLKPEIRTETIIRHPNGEEIKLTPRPHVAFRECLRRFDALGKLWMVGPAGTGKTHMAAQLAEATGARMFGFISCTAGMSETWLLGRPTLSGDYISTPFVDCYENGGVFLWDEADAMDANTALCVNSALSNGRLYLPSRTGNHVALRHETFRPIFATNTYGVGADTQYTGREAMDAATRDRFAAATVMVDYDTELERTFLPNGSLAETLWKLRKGIRSNNIRRIVSTRAFIDCAAMLAVGYSEGECVDALTLPWTAEEKRKAML